MDHPNSSRTAEQILASYLANLEAGEEVDLEGLLAEHPEHADELRKLHSKWSGASEELTRSSLRDRGNAPEPLAPSIEEGATIGDYKLVKLLGRGGMGQVWEAQQISLSRRVALKLLLPDRIDTRALDFFEREARAGGRLAHPSIVAVYGTGEQDGLAWIAMELVPEGYDLRAALDEFRGQNRLPDDYYAHVATLVTQIADALEYAHAQGIIHRDLKPRNVLISEDDRPKIADFGVAKVVDENSLSQAGDLVGTWYYMSPEQLAAKRIQLDHRTDIFSLGVMMYELLALRRPFDGDTTQQLAQQIMTIDPPDPQTFRSKVPRDLSVICQKALEKEADRRYSTMGELAADLRRHLNSEPILARPPSAMERAVKWARRNPAKSVGLAVASVALIVIGVLWAKAEEQRGLAQENAKQAAIEKGVAEERMNDVLSLSASRDLKALQKRAATAWPPHPDQVETYEQWLEDAEDMQRGCLAADQEEVWSRPSLALHRTKLAQLRALAEPESDAGRLAAAKAHPEYPELRAARGEQTWLRRMLGLEPWPDEAEVRQQLQAEGLPESAKDLSLRAIQLTDPAAPAWGAEIRAVILASLALESAQPDERGPCLECFARAHLRAGRLEAAQAAIDELGTLAGEGPLLQLVSDLQASVASWTGEQRNSRRADLDRIDERIRGLEITVGERCIKDVQSSWWHAQLTELVEGIEELHDPRAGLACNTLDEPFGWGIRKRLQFAQTLEERSLTGSAAQALWNDALERIAASPLYAGLSLTPQMGLLPIGPDPRSELWEFAHLASGQPAERGPGGDLILGDDTGIVLVLIPEGTFVMGAQSVDPEGRNFDPQAEDAEGPPREVQISAFFMSKYEMTQSQWLRAAGVNPSHSTPGTPFVSSLTHPVEQVSWSDCDEVVFRYGLSLPTEAQWEYAARAGTSTRWYSGDQRESLQGHANLADKAAADAGAPWPALADWPEFDDGTVMHCAIGTYQPNAFGLHETAGNMWEYCADAWNPDAYESLPDRDPVATGSPDSTRVFRGGSYHDTAYSARVTNRSSVPDRGHARDVGLRPARRILP